MFLKAQGQGNSTQEKKMAASKIMIPGRPIWQQTMLRIRDPSKSIAFYKDFFGMTLIDKFDFPQYAFSLYFLATLPASEKYGLIPGTKGWS